MTDDTPLVAQVDGFRGDNDALCRAIEALLSLDAAGALVPHGIGGHARTLLSAASARLAASQSSAERIASLEAKLTDIQGDIDGDDRPEWISHLLNIANGIEDEGDRFYFGSTNDADLLQEIATSLDTAGHPLKYFRRPDLHRHNDELRATIASLEARVAELEAGVREAKEAVDALSGAGRIGNDLITRLDQLLNKGSEPCPK